MSFIVLGAAFVVAGVLIVRSRASLAALMGKVVARETRAQSLLNAERVEREEHLYKSDAGIKVNRLSATVFGLVLVAAGLYLIVRGAS